MTRTYATDESAACYRKHVENVFNGYVNPF